MNKKSRSVMAVMTLVGISAWSVGCTDYLNGVTHTNPPAWKASASASSSAASSLSRLAKSAVSAASSEPITGSWVCAAGQTGCDPATVKTVAESAGSLETDQTLYLPPNRPKSICRVHEKSQLTMAGNTDPNTFNGQVSVPDGTLTESSENTHDCSEVVKSKYTGDRSTPSSALVYDKSKDRLTIDGVAYSRIPSPQAQAIVSQNAATSPLTAASLVDSKWRCVDAGSEADRIAFLVQAPGEQPTAPAPNQNPVPAQRGVRVGGARNAMPVPQPPAQQQGSGQISFVLHDWVMEFSQPSVKCRVSEISSFSIYDAEQPQEVWATLTPSGELQPHSSKMNTDIQKCTSAVADWNSRQSQKGGSAVSTPIERDGLNKISFQGKNYYRCGNDCSVPTAQ